MMNITVLKNGLIMALALAPLGILTIKHWMDGLFILSSFISIVILISRRALKDHANLFDIVREPWVLAICLAMTAPFLAVLISQAIRQEFEISYFDSPARFLSAIPIIVALLATHKNHIAKLNYIFSVTVLFTFVVMPFLPHSGWSVAQPGRMTSYFVDPLTFGRISLELAVISIFLPLSSAEDARYKRLLVALVKVCVLVCGLILSIRSGSRTGWLALPFITLLSGMYFFRVSWAKGILLSLIVMGALGYATMHVDTTMNRRFELALQEFKAYQWNAMNQDESIPMRISFLRIGIDLFELKPIAGWGDRGFKEYINDEKMKVYSSAFTRHYVLTAGFHNELITNMVRSGVWGMLSTLLIFLVPLLYFSMQWARRKRNIYAFCGICFIVFEAASGMSTEVTNLKFTAAYYAYNIVWLFFQSYRYDQGSNDFSSC